MIGKTALKQFQALNNNLSDTQRAALESGTVGYEASIFKGKPDWKSLFAMEKPSLTEEEQAFVDNETEELCEMIDDWEITDKLHDLPEEVWDFLKKKRFFGLMIPKKYGGLGFSAQAHAAIVSKIASRSGTAAANAMVPNSLGPAELLMNYGTKEQQDYYLPRLADGREIPCFSLTSPQAGSDATNQKDEGVIFKGEDNKLYMRMNWEKRYITLAPNGTLFGIAFRLKDPDHLLGNKDDYGLTLALIPADTPGVSKGLRHRPMGMPFQNGPHWGKDVVVPLDQIIGGPDYAGKGWNMIVDCLSVGRSISLPASSAGTARYASLVTGAYSFVRQQSSRPLAQMQGIQEPLARIGGLTYMIDAARMLPLQELDQAHEKGEQARPAVASAILKYHTTEAARRIAIDAMDIHGGKGICEGPNNPVGKLYQGVTTSITVEGANILTRNMMIFGQSAFLAHPYTLKELQVAKDVDSGALTKRQGAREAGRLIRKHLCNIFNNAVRGFALNLTKGKGSHAPQRGPDKKFYQHINRLASAYAHVANVSTATLQARMIREQRTGALLGDTFSNLYLASQVLRRWNLEGRQEADRPLMEWACTYCLDKAEEALYEAIDNHPSKLAKAWLKPTAFPRGRQLKKPAHKLDAKVAQILSTPGPARDRLTAGAFVPQGDQEYITRLEKAFALAQEAYPHEQKLIKAAAKGELSQAEDHVKMIEEGLEKGLIDQDTATLLIKTHEARTDIITVDSFPFEWDGKPVQKPPRHDIT